jgi:chemotaxis protein MotB
MSLAGYTDAAQFVGGVRGFSNWELSANRANSSRRELVAGGLDDTKVLRVVGLASSVLFNPNDPLSPANRRISITVLNKRTEMAILQENSEDVEVDDDDEQSIQNLADQLP